MCVTIFPQISPTAVVLAGARAYSGAPAFARVLMTAPPPQLHRDLMRWLRHCVAISDRVPLKEDNARIHRWIAKSRRHL